MKDKTFNPIITVSLIMILLSSIAFSQSKSNPNSKMRNHKKMDNMTMMDSCKTMMKNMKGHMNNKTMMDSCKMLMNNPKHNKKMGKMKNHKMMNMKEHMKGSMMDSCKAMMGKMKNHKMMNMKDHKMMKKNMNMNNHNKSVNKESIIRKGVIDLVAIDKNKDGFVYQDRMDWNVISDKPGKCPLCGMKLKKYSIKQARKNLIENGFKVK